MELPELAQLPECFQADFRKWERDGSERRPDVFTEGARDRLFANEGELFQGFVVLVVGRQQLDQGGWV